MSSQPLKRTLSALDDVLKTKYPRPGPSDSCDEDDEDDYSPTSPAREPLEDAPPLAAPYEYVTSCLQKPAFEPAVKTAIDAHIGKLLAIRNGPPLTTETVERLIGMGIRSMCQVDGGDCALFLREPAIRCLGKRGDCVFCGRVLFCD